MEISPMTLIWLTVGRRASLRASRATEKERTNQRNERTKLDSERGGNS